MNELTEDWSQPARTVVEYGWMLDCVKQGCIPHHSDNGRVLSRGPVPDAGLPTNHDHVINNHACTLVTRTVTYTGWEAVHEASH